MIDEIILIIIITIINVGRVSIDSKGQPMTSGHQYLDYHTDADADAQHTGDGDQ